jgi:hypothetical protein
VEILDEYQPPVSNLLHGKIATVSVEKLLTWSDRLMLKTTLTVRPAQKRAAAREFHSGLRARSAAPGRARSRVVRQK